MTKVLDILLTTPLSIIDKKLGQQVSGIGLTVLGTITGNPLLSALGAYQLQRGFAPQAPKAEQTENALRISIPPRVSGYGTQRLYWAYALYVTATDGTAVDVGAFHDGRIDSISGYYLGDKVVTLNGSGFVAELDDGQFGGNVVQIGTTLGPAVNTAFAPVIAKVPEIWTSNHRGDGVVTGFALWKPVKTKNYQKVYAGGGPNAMPLSLVMKLQPVFDWRDGTQSVGDPLTWKWSENAILHLAHYLLVRDNKTWAKHFTPTLAYWTAAANVADEAVPLKAGGTEPRYRGCVVHKHTDEHKSVVAALLGCCDGWMSPRADGALVVYAGRYQAPAVTVDDRDVISYSVQNGVEEENAVNTIPLTYVSAAHDYTVVDTDSWVDNDDIERRGKELSSSGLANQVPSHSQARRLGKRAIAEAMAPKRGTATLRSTGRKILGQRYIRLVLSEVGFDETVQVKAPVKRDPTTGQVSFAWIIADANVDSWNPATEEGSPAPVGNTVASEPLNPPAIDTAVADYGSDSGAGSVGVFLRLLIDGPDREDLTWYLRTREVGASVWGEREYNDIDPGATVELATEFVPANTSVEVEAAYATGDGRVSPWSAASIVNTSTADLPPQQASELAATGGSGAVIVSYRNPFSLNFSYARVYRGTTTVFADAVQVGLDQAGGLGESITVIDNVGAGSYRYWVRTFNPIGAGGSPLGPVTASST
jgi:hypothetical protein